MRFAIVVSTFNPEVTQGLLEGAKNYLEDKRVPMRSEDVFHAPGAFEIPLIARELAKKKHYSGVICLGCVIKGETAHFEYISLAATVGLVQSSLETRKPITFGILTAYDEAQALARSRLDEANKGREAAAACFESALTLARISE